jgi:DNA-binding LytR/AlgR family response regulator
LKGDGDDLNHAARTGQAPGDQRPLPGMTGKPSGPKGVFSGMTGGEWRQLRRAWLLGLGIVAMIAFINILTIQHDAPELGLVSPVIWETSSALVIFVLLGMPAGMALWMIRIQPRWWAAAPAHLVAVLIYSALHVAGFVALRIWAHGLLGQHYHFGPLSTEFPYEFRKDIMSYGLATIIFWLALRRGGQKLAQPPAPAAPAVFDIHDGARMIRVPVSEILAVRSAGNYAEFVLADGRRPLTRASLGAVLDSLAPHGFVRSHKSWLVNPARVTGLKPEGSGDFAIELGDLEVPLSRRFPDALATLRR